MPTQPNTELTNKLADITFTLEQGKGKKKQSQTIKLGDVKIIDQFKKSHNIFDIINQGIKAQKAENAAESEKLYFAEQMVQLAMTCPSPDAFEGLTKTALDSLRLGRAPAGTSKDEAKLWNPIPQVIKDYRYKILKAWREGIKPMSKATVLKTVKGKKTGVREDMNTPGAMMKALAYKTSKAKPKDIKIEGVKPNGEQTLHMDLGELIGQVTELYNTATADGKIIVHNSLENLLKILAKHQEQPAAKPAKGDQAADKKAA